ncbi:type II toxin-antitoxin system VapB family antitoxin [Bradyrhizobium sp. USDA 241]|uniref:type II toxin-antitoxin system VapB family antitoxin n=1 Tax=Bradyrhizobium sp. USDA 241 TaxID=3377725 RepID=UPI003C7708D5
MCQRHDWQPHSAASAGGVLSSANFAVRLALEHELQRVREKQPASERAAASIAIARTMGPGGGSFDMKTFTDDMWGDI